MRSRKGKKDQDLQNLIPIAVAVASGCSPCAQATVVRALKSGSSAQSVEQTLQIISYMQGIDCIIQAIAPDTRLLMEKALFAASAQLRSQWHIPSEVQSK